MIVPWVRKDIEDSFKWIAIGRLIPQKGYDDLLLAVFKLKRKGYSISLEIFGEGPLRSRLSNKIFQLGIQGEVKLMGNLPMAWRELYNYNAFVLPSHSEGFSGALVEALMTGIPLVASDIPMNLEAISPGRLVNIFQTGNVSDLVSKMENLMNNYDMACSVGEICRKRAIDNYDIRSIASTYETALFSLLKNKSK